MFITSRHIQRATFLTRNKKQPIVCIAAPSTFIPLLPRLYSSSPDSGFKNTAPSSSKPSVPKTDKRNPEEGYLSFTKSSLYKLALPLSPSDNPISSGRSGAVQRSNDDNLDKDAGETWEQRVERGEEPFDKQDGADAEESKARESVIFLLHSGQPLSYITNLIRAEAPATESGTQAPEQKLKSGPCPLGDPPITFHTSMQSKRRWSPATGIGDFLREASRMGNFTISIGPRHVRVNVPTFEERTRFLRVSLQEKTRRIERLARVKDECDRIARRATQRYAFAGAGIMSSWWLTVGLLTFNTPLGWDVMEPVTYLTGFGMAIGGYFWFLWHNREVSYRTLLTETTSRRQDKLYAERGFDIDSYQEHINEAKGLRRAIKRVAWDYDLDWDQGDTEAGRTSQRALEIIRREEDRDRRRKHREDDDEKEEDAAFAQVDDGGDGQPDRK